MRLCPRQAELCHVKIIEFLILLPLPSPHTLHVTTIIGGGTWQTYMMAFFICMPMAGVTLNRLWISELAAS